MQAIATIALTSAALTGISIGLVTVVGLDRNNAPLPAAAEPEPAVVQIVAADGKAARLPAFDERFEKWQAIPPAIATEPIPVISTGPVGASAEAELPSRSVKPVKRIRTARAEARDICERHGMHKRYTRGGRSWRCRK
jgi:hypothetical protein